MIYSILMSAWWKTEVAYPLVTNIHQGATVLSERDIGSYRYINHILYHQNKGMNTNVPKLKMLGI